MDFIDNAAPLDKSTYSKMFFANFIIELGTGMKIFNFTLSLEGLQYTFGNISSGFILLISVVQFSISIMVMWIFVFEYIEDCRQALAQPEQTLERLETLLWKYEKMKSSLEIPLLIIFAVTESEILLSLYSFLTMNGKY